MSNPLLEFPSRPFGAVPFDQIRDDHFEPALSRGIEMARENLASIRASGSAPDFANTIEALETATETVDQVSRVFSNLLSAHTNDRLQGLAKEMMPKLAALANDIYLDEALFERVRRVYEAKPSSLDTESRELLEKTYKAFVRNGARLDEKGKARLREIDQRLAVLSQVFSDHVLAATNAFELWISDRKDLAGLPESVVESYAQAARQKGREGQWLVTLQYPSIGPFLTFSERRELREKLARAQWSRATSGENDNRPVLLEIARLRHERANLLGFKTHAHFVLEERMASSPETVKQFVDRILKASKPAAKKDLEEVRELSGLGDRLEPWDLSFYSEKLKQKKYQFDEEELRPYFKLENVIEGVFETSRKLYGLAFQPRTDVPAYHPDVRVFEVTEEKSGEHVGLLYADFFPRPSKRGGAWMTSFRDQGWVEGKDQRPHVSIVCNFSQPTAERPSLLRMHEVRTLFHEFGHALHLLLSKTKYRSLCGPNVYWDFVELPSQIMENWARERDGLLLFARHFETGKPMPDGLIRRVEESERFQAGWMSLRQVSFGVLDMAWHFGDPSNVEDVEEFEHETLKDVTLFRPKPGQITSCGFSHIFAGGYSAGYYSYKWAEVLAADAFELFKEKGIFDAATARKFREEILARGGSEHPMRLYVRFRGREPDPDALLRRDGLIT